MSNSKLSPSADPAKPSRLPSQLRGYFIALAAVAAGLLLRLGLTCLVGPGLPTYITFYPAVMVAALLAGLGPGLLATGATLLVAAYWVLPPQGFGVGSAVETVGLGLFAGMGTFTSVFAELFRRARHQAAAYEKKLALQESQEELRASEARLKRSQEIAHLGSWELDLATNQLTWSDEVYRIFGLQPREFSATYQAFLDAVHPEDRSAVDAAYSASLRDGKDSYEIEHRVLQKGTGQVRWVHEKCAHVRDASGRLIRSVGMVHDITERKQTEEALRKLNRTLNALKESSQAMLRATSEPDYLKEVCKIVVQDCGHAMVWIGFSEEDEARSIRPAASSGFEEGYLETLKLTWADTERGRGPTGTAIRTGKVSSCRDMLTDPRFEPWRAEALKRGYASSIALPLLANGRAFGALTLYSRRPDSFSEDEQKLLADLADDLAYGIQALRLRAAQAVAEEQLRLLSTAVASAVNGIVITDPKGRFLWVNPAFTELTGYTQAEVLGRTARLLKSGQHSAEFYARMWATILRGEPWHGELVNRRKDGSLYTEEMTITPVRAGGTAITHFVAIKQDVTERKRAEMRTDLLAETASQLLTTDSPQRLVESLCRKVLAFLDCDAFFNFLVDEEQRRLHLNACAGISESDVSRIEWLDFGVAICGCAARDGCRLVAENIQAASDPRASLVKSFGLQAYACHPLMVGGRLLGTLSFGTRTRAHFTDEELSLMKAVADQVAIAMDRQRTRETLRKINEELERRVAERTAEVQESEARYRSLVTATASIVWTTNTQGEIVEDLPTWQAFTGQTFEQYKGSGWAQAVHPEDRERTAAVWAKAVAGGSAYETEYRLRRHDGQYRYTLARGVPVLEPDGSAREWVGTCTDISEQKEAERRREFTTALLALFARKSLASDYLNSVVDILRQLSGCQALGIRVKNQNQEIPYESWAGFEPAFLELEHRLSLQQDKCFCIRAISQDFLEQDKSLLTRGGSFRADDAIAFAGRLAPDQCASYRGNCMKFGFASLAVIPIRYRDEVIGAIHLADRRPGHFPLPLVEFIESVTPLIGEALHRFQTEAELSRHRDHLEVLVLQRTSELEAINARLQSEIAERRRAQDGLQQTAEELKRSNRDLEQFAYVASHDLQEPLRAVGGYVKLLQRRFPQDVDPKAKEFIAGAVDGAARMERLITDLLAFSRVGTRGAAFAPADLNAVLEDALRNLQGSVKSAQATITHDSLPTLSVDAPQILQLFQNLIGNAIKFRGERPPEIHVSARQEPDRWVFSVRDNGIGIEPQYFDRIFQIFQRLHTRKHYPGTGIGLAICKKIVERHGGAIWVESPVEAGFQPASEGGILAPRPAANPGPESSGVVTRCPRQGTTFYFSIPTASGTRGVPV